MFEIVTFVWHTVYFQECNLMSFKDSRRTSWIFSRMASTALEMCTVRLLHLGTVRYMCAHVYIVSWHDQVETWICRQALNLIRPMNSRWGKACAHTQDISSDLQYVPFLSAGQQLLQLEQSQGKGQLCMELEVSGWSWCNFDKGCLSQILLMRRTAVRTLSIDILSLVAQPGWGKNRHFRHFLLAVLVG